MHRKCLFHHFVGNFLFFVLIFFVPKIGHFWQKNNSTDLYWLSSNSTDFFCIVSYTWQGVLSSLRLISSSMYYQKKLYQCTMSKICNHLLPVRYAGVKKNCTTTKIQIHKYKYTKTNTKYTVSYLATWQGVQPPHSLLWTLVAWKHQIIQLFAKHQA